MLKRIFGTSSPRRFDVEHFSRSLLAADSAVIYQALAAAWPHLQSGPQRILDISTDPGPWLQTIREFSGPQHQLFGARHGVEIPRPLPPFIQPLELELDIWWPLHLRECPHALHEKNFSLITALDLADRMYHPDHFFRVAAKALAPGGLLLIATRNGARLANVTRLLRGGGMAGSLPQIIRRPDAENPRPVFREYCWNELVGAARLAGLGPVSHSFFADSAARSEITDFDDRVQKIVSPFAHEAGQLQSGMILAFRLQRQLSPREAKFRKIVGPFVSRAQGGLRRVRRQLQRMQVNL